MIMASKNLAQRLFLGLFAIMTFGFLSCYDENYSSESERYSGREIEFKTTVKSRKISYDNKELTIYSLEIDYDEQNFIPLRINESLFYSERANKEISEGFWDGSLDMKITNFQIK